MARRGYVKGKSVQDLLKMGYDEFIHLTGSELRQVTGRMADAANKRLKRMGKTKTPAVMQAERSGGKFSTKGKDIDQLRAEYARVRAFLENPSSTKKGYEKLKKEMGNEVGDEIPQERAEGFWDVYRRLSEIDPKFKKLPPSDRIRAVQREMEARPDQSVEQHMKNIQREMEAEYERQQEERSKVDFSDFFEQ